MLGQSRRRSMRFMSPRPDPARPVVLVFGPDAGLVSERVNALVKASVDDSNDPFSLVRLEGEDLAANPARLVEEAQTIPLFGGRRAVWVKAGSRNIAPAVEALLALPASECRVVIEAGDLRRNAPLRALCERAKNAAALPCYTDTERDLERLIDAEMRAAGLTLAPEARALLIPLLGGDRAASRNEIRKLVLYARGRGEIGVDDVAAVVSDASALALDDLVDAAFAGRPAELETQLAKARAAGSAGRLDLLCRAAPAGAAAQMAHRDRRRRALLARRACSRRCTSAASRWSKPRSSNGTRRGLRAAMAELADAVLASRKTPALADTIAERALLSLAVKARRSGGVEHVIANEVKQSS